MFECVVKIEDKREMSERRLNRTNADRVNEADVCTALVPSFNRTSSIHTVHEPLCEPSRCCYYLLTCYYLPYIGSCLGLIWIFDGFVFKIYALIYVYMQKVFFQHNFLNLKWAIQTIFI